MTIVHNKVKVSYYPTTCCRVSALHKNDLLEYKTFLPILCDNSFGKIHCLLNYYSEFPICLLWSSNQKTILYCAAEAVCWKWWIFIFCGRAQSLFGPKQLFRLLFHTDAMFFAICIIIQCIFTIGRRILVKEYLIFFWFP